LHRIFRGFFTSNVCGKNYEERPLPFAVKSTFPANLTDSVASNYESSTSFYPSPACNRLLSDSTLSR